MKPIERICKGTPPGVPALRYDISSPTRANISHQRYIAPHSGISQIPQGIYIAANKNLPSVEGRFFRVSKNPQIVKTQKIHPIKSVGDGSPVPKVIFSKMPCYARRFDLLLGATLLSIRIHFGVAVLVFGASLTSGSLSKT